MNHLVGNVTFCIKLLLDELLLILLIMQERFMLINLYLSKSGSADLILNSVGHKLAEF